MSQTDELLLQLDALSEADCGPFPYAGCRWMQRVHSACHGLEPDLDVYLSELARYRSWRRKILMWSDDKIGTVEERLTASFFERFPSYANLSSSLTARQASDVQLALQIADDTRRVLLQLLSIIRRERTLSGNGS